MAEVCFSCPRCQRDLEAPEQSREPHVVCPSCGSTVLIPGRRMRRVIQPAETVAPTAGMNLSPAKPDDAWETQPEPGKPAPAVATSANRDGAATATPRADGSSQEGEAGEPDTKWGTIALVIAIAAALALAIVVLTQG